MPPRPHHPGPESGSGTGGSDGGWLGRLLSDPAGMWRRGWDTLREAWATHAPLLAATGTSALWAGVALWLLVRTHRRAAWATGARWVEVTAGPHTDPGGGKLLWSTLGGIARPWWRRLLFGQPHLSFEIHATPERLRIGFWVPGPIPVGKIERAIRAAWPGARTHTRPAPAPYPFPPPAPGEQLTTAAAKLRLGASHALPLHGDQPSDRPSTHTPDPLRAVLAALTPLEPGHSACIQILARPTTGLRARTTRRAATQHLAGGPTSAQAHVLALARAIILAPLAILTTPTSTRSAHPAAHHRATTTATSGTGGGGRSVARDPHLPRVVHHKTGHGQLWAAQLRYATTLTTPNPTNTTAENTAGDTGGEDATSDAQPTTPPEDDAELARERLREARRICVGRADTVGGAFAAYTSYNRLRRRRLWRSTAMTRRWMGRGQIFSVAELAALAHLPTDPRTPGLAQAGAQLIPPPPVVPTGGAGTKPLGVAAGTTRPVALTVHAARSHLHTLGETGSGKTTLIANLALADITARRGTALLDPKGDLGRDVYIRIPTALRDKVVLLDPATSGPPPVLNLLDPHHPASVEHLIGIFAHIYRQHWGNRTEEAFRVACLTELAYYEHRAHRDPHTPPPHLGDVLDLFTDDAHRHRATQTLTSPAHRYLRGYWSAYHQLTPHSQALLAGPVTNRLRALLLRPFPRAVLTGTGPALDMADVLDHGGIAIARLPEDSLGTDTVRLLGSLLVARAWHAATARAHLPEHARPDASLYLDEAHLFLSMPHSLEDLLTRARAFRLSLTLAHQHLAQLPTELRAALATNALTKIFFRAPEDARELEHHLAPHLSAHDLAHLDPYTAAARIHHAGNNTAAFTLATHPLPPPTP